MRKNIYLSLFALISAFCFSQAKKTVPKSTYDKNFSEIVTSTKDVPFEITFYNDNFQLGQQFEKPTSIDVKPKVDYYAKSDVYRYLYKLDDVNFSLYLKGNRIVEKQIIVFDINHFLSIIRKYNLIDKEFITGKGLKLDEETYLLISKDRQDTYDSYTLDFRSPEFFNILDYMKSQEK